MQPVNLLAILVCGVIAMVLGSVWYGPLFGKMWTKLLGHSDMGNKKEMPKLYAIQFVASLVMAYVTAQFVMMAGALTAMEGAMVGFWAAVGFVAMSHVGAVLFAKQPVKLYYIDVGYYLVLLVVFGAVLAMWQ